VRSLADRCRPWPGRAAAVPLALAAPLTLALAAAGGPAIAQAEPVTLKLERALGAHRAPGPSPRHPTYARADHMQGVVDETVQMDGAVELRSAGVTVRGDSAEYLCASDEAKVHGNARLYDHGTIFSGPELDYRLEAHTGQMPQASYTYSPRHGRGESSLIEFLGEDKYRMHHATYSNCAPGDDSWWVKAETLDIDRQEQRAVGHHATMYFEGVPIISSPYFSMPLSDQRRSGVLTPSYYYDSRSGFEATVPYYWNMAPNYDYTITPALYPRLGALLGNEFRLLEPNLRGIYDYDLMPHDRATGDTRSHVMVNQQYASGFGLSGAINYNRVSDDRFLTDFSHSLVEQAPVELPQNESVSYGQTYWNASVQVARNQTLLSLLNPPGTAPTAAQIPYDRVPEFTLNGSNLDWQGFDLTGTIDATKFRNHGLEEGDRFIFNPSLSYPDLSASYFVVPKIQWHLTEYDLDPHFHNGESNATRALPIGSIDSGLIFERNSEWLGRSATQTLEPRIFYAYIPFRNQNNLPNFDSTDPTFTFAQLFTENAYTGSDRIGEANQVTTAVTSRMIENESGAERFRAAIGQRFYFGPQRVTIPGDTTTRTNLTSDLLLEVSAQTAREWKVETELEYSALDSQIVRADVAVRWQPKAASVVDLSYRYQSALLHQIDLATQWPLTRKWYGVADLNYSLLGRGGTLGQANFSNGRAWVQQILGLEYKADCWVGRLVGQRYATNGGVTRTTTVFLQIELNGFTSIGTRSPLDQLRRSIPGYQRVSPLPAPAGPFDNYE
jgi:LPS-assembly protein